MVEKFPMTADGFKKLKVELEHLKNTDRPKVIKDIAEAREHGDLSENAEYHAARERQSFIEGKIAELENKICFKPFSFEYLSFGERSLARGL